jgi:hypothetical protein
MRFELEIRDKKSFLLGKRNASITLGTKLEYDRMIDALEWVLGERDILDGSLCGDPTEAKE